MMKQSKNDKDLFQGFMEPGINQEKIELNILRRKILFELSINPRFSYSLIAKNLGVSQEVVSYNINWLKDKKILNGSIAIINPEAINCQSYELYIRLQNYSYEKLKEFIDYFVSNPKIRWVANGSGHFDLMLSVVCKNFEEFNKVLNEIKTKLENHLVNYLMLPLLEEDFLYSFFFNENYDAQKVHERITKFKGKDDGSFQKYFVEAKNHKFEQMKLDDTDKRIISILESNTTESLLNISKKIDVSVNTVKNRIIALIKNKVILRFFPLISVNPLGYQWHLAMLNMDFDEETEKKFLYFITMHPYIVYYAKTIGQYNYILSLTVKDAVHYNSIMLELRNKFHKHLKEYEDLLIFTQYKYVYFANIIKHTS
ncbi:Lrp/AsnC family transcriptional regulator [Candidatus Woesearchaeota archaeon]|nr:Lrp/AsnC family transcriptional regulator [Candidatus Woesearchaeota archaeon]